MSVSERPGRKVGSLALRNPSPTRGSLPSKWRVLLWTPTMWKSRLEKSLLKLTLLQKCIFSRVNTSGENQAKHTAKIPHSLGSPRAFRANISSILVLVLSAFNSLPKVPSWGQNCDYYSDWRNDTLNSPLGLLSPSLKTTWFTFRIQRILPANTRVFLNPCSFANPVLHTPGTAQIGEGIESSWGDLEESEKEEAAEEEGESEAAAFECEKVETEDTSTMRETKNSKYSFFLISALIITSFY